MSIVVPTPERLRKHSYIDSRRLGTVGGWDCPTFQHKAEPRRPRTPATLTLFGALLEPRLGWGKVFMLPVKADQDATGRVVGWELAKDDANGVIECTWEVRYA